MTTLTYQDNILIAETLEKLQDLNSELYGDWYTKLYHAVGHEENWNFNTLHILEQLLLDNTHSNQTQKTMTLSKAQFDQFVENYVIDIVKGLDIDSLESMVTDLLIREYETYSEEHILGEIKEIYNEEYAQELLDSVADVTVA